MLDMFDRIKAYGFSALRTVQRHPQRTLTAIGVSLLCFGATAFGVAPLAPDAAQLPVRQVLESVSFDIAVDTEPSKPNLDWLGRPVASAEEMRMYRHEWTRREDTMTSLLRRLGVQDVKAMSFMQSDPFARELLQGRPGKQVAVEVTPSQQLIKLTARWPAADERAYRKLTIEKVNDQWLARVGFGDLKPVVRAASGTIQSSLFSATDAAGIPDAVATQLADIFSSDIDFRRDLRKGDRFAVIYESLEAEGEPMRTGRILTAEFINNGDVLQSVWFQEAGSKGGYYGFDGKSRRRSYLASPLEFSRVSSGYGMRFHPISGNLQPHLGVDFAAPTGTSVRVVGDGVVSFAGWQNGYGNIIEVEHRNGHTTAYAHLSRIDVKKGQKVEQGEFIGAVGSTGASTGPHLHFEFRIKGVHQDPMNIAKEGESVPISAASRNAFNATVSKLKAELAAIAGTTQVASR